jgi:DNA-binding CsgD family transcriptional regulator/PAS domain-containing protein
LYEAPLDPSRWEEFLRLTAAAVAGEAAALLMHDFRNTQSLMASQWGFHPEVAQCYAAYYGAIDVWRAAVTASADWLGTSEQFVAPASLVRTEFYNDLLLPYEIPHGMFAMVERGPGRVANLSICRGQRGGPFEEKDLDILKFLKPHIQRAYRLHSELCAERERNIGFEATLEMLPTAVILLDARGQILFMTRSAQHQISQNDGLIAIGNCLTAERPSEAAELQRLIAEAVSTSTGKGLNAAGSLSVTRKNGIPVYVLVTPVREPSMNATLSPCAVLFVNDPAKRARPPEEILRRLFELTPAECRVTLLIAEGRSPLDIAQLIGVSANTLKTQLSSIYSKTRTSGQPALVRLLTQLAIQFPKSNGTHS